MTAKYLWADHRVFPRPGGAVLFGVEQASLFAIDHRSRDVLDRWRSRDPILLQNAPAGDRELLDGFREAGILVPRDSKGPRPWRIPDPADVPLATLVIEVAQDCNMGCTYCYAAGGTYGGEPKLLEPGLARRAARYLVAASGDRNELTLVLFGGEPLLNLPALRAAVEEAETLAQDTGKRLSVCVTTNGTLLNADTVSFFHQHRVGVSVSLDGPPDLHDANRPYRNGKGTYATIEEGLRLLLQGSPRPVAARVTLVPSQWSRMPEVFHHVMGLGFHEVGIAPASPVSEELLPTREQEEDLFEGVSILARRFVEEAEQGRILPFSNLIDLLARLHTGQVKGAPCGAGLGYLALDADGRFFVCHRLAGEEAFCVGDLESGPRPGAVRACLNSALAPRTEACSACWARALCCGGCHYENHLRENILGKPPGGTCNFVRRWVELGIEVYARVCEGGGSEVLSRLSERAAI